MYLGSPGPRVGMLQVSSYQSGVPGIAIGRTLARNAYSQVTAQVYCIVALGRARRCVSSEGTSGGSDTSSHCKALHCVVAVWGLPSFSVISWAKESGGDSKSHDGGYGQGGLGVTQTQEKSCCLHSWSVALGKLVALLEPQSPHL